MAQRFYGNKDLATFEKFNRELIGEPNISDDGIIDQFVILYRTSVYDTETNMYGEASDGKVYKQGVKLPCIVDAEDFDFNYDDFGPDNKQNVSFAFQRLPVMWIQGISGAVELRIRPDSWVTVSR